MSCISNGVDKGNIIWRVDSSIIDAHKQGRKLNYHCACNTERIIEHCWMEFLVYFLAVSLVIYHSVSYLRITWSHATWPTRSGISAPSSQITRETKWHIPPEWRDRLRHNGPVYLRLLARYVKLRVAHAPGMPGTLSLPPPVWRSRHASRHVRDARAGMHVRIANWRFQ